MARAVAVAGAGMSAAMPLGLRDESIFAIAHEALT